MPAASMVVTIVFLFNIFLTIFAFSILDMGVAIINISSWLYIFLFVFYL